jgi:glutathione S-transferase
VTLALYVFPVSPRAFKVLFAAHHLGIDYDLRYINLFKGEQNAPEYRALNPSGRMPTMDHDGYVLWESNAIVNYLASLKPESGVLPADARGRGAIEKWQFFDSNHWDPACAAFVFERLVKKIIGRGDADPAEIAKAEANFARNAELLDGQLQNHRYVMGDALTVADFSLGGAMAAAEIAQYPLEPYRAIQRWHADLKSLAAWQAAVELQRKYPPV